MQDIYKKELLSRLDPIIDRFVLEFMNYRSKVVDIEKELLYKISVNDTEKEKIKNMQDELNKLYKSIEEKTAIEMDKYQKTLDYLEQQIKDNEDIKSELLKKEDLLNRREKDINLSNDRLTQDIQAFSIKQDEYDLKNAELLKQIGDYNAKNEEIKKQEIYLINKDRNLKRKEEEISKDNTEIQITKNKLSKKERELMVLLNKHKMDNQ